MTANVLISDLHLEEARPDLASFFEELVSVLSGRIDTLYILGDFFESWIGDDGAGDFESAIADSLRHLRDSGTAIRLMHGNRDFLIGQQWLDTFGGELLEDPVSTTIAGTPVTLMHGDSLCTDDVQYMKFRATARSPQWQQQILAMPIAQRRQLAQALRGASKESQTMKSAEIMDANAQAILDAFMRHGTPWIIHGHTHRPAIHSYTVDGNSVFRMVLGDWSDHTHIGWLTPDNPPALVRIDAGRVAQQLDDLLHA